MSYRRLFCFLFVCALMFGSPVLLPAAGGGEATQLYDYEGGMMCVWQCYNGSGGSAVVTRPYGKNCLNLCAASCGGPCVPLY